MVKFSIFNSMVDSIHKKALDFFIEHQEEFVEKYNGKELLLHGAELVGAFNSISEAYREGISRFGAGNFSLQKCIPGEDAYTVNVYTFGLVG